LPGVAPDRAARRDGPVRPPGAAARLPGRAAPAVAPGARHRPGERGAGLGAGPARPGGPDGAAYRAEPDLEAAPGRAGAAVLGGPAGGAGGGHPRVLCRHGTQPDLPRAGGPAGGARWRTGRPEVAGEPIVTDVKELCELALDGPEPPLRPAAEALRIARRETRRRDRVRMVVAGLALLSGIGGVAVVAPTVGPGGPTAPPVTAASRPAPSLRYLEPAPDAAAAEAHGEQIVGLLAAEAAEGSTTTPAPRVLEGTATWQLPWSGEGYVSTTQLAIGDETGTGLLAVILRAGAPAPAGDP